MGRALGAVGVGDVEDPVGFEFGDEPRPLVEEAVVSPAEQDEVV